MQTYFSSFFEGVRWTLYEARFTLLAFMLVIAAWVLVATLVPEPLLDLVVYAVFGYTALGGLCTWTGRKLKERYGPR